MHRTRRHLSFANVISLIALFVALGGTGYAAVQLADNSVGARQIKKNAVGVSEIKKNGVRSGEVKNGSLRASDFRAGQLPQGEQGIQGIQGIQGPAGVVGAVTIQRTDAPLADNSTGSAEVSCPAGQRALGGGSSVDQTGSDDISQLVSRPGTGAAVPDDGSTFDTWRVVYRNPAGGTAAATIRAFVICAEVPASP